MSDIFISYSSFDREKAAALANALEQRGQSVWFDRHILPGSNPPFAEIEKQLNLARCVLVLWSKSSVESQFVRSEATAAQKRKALLPVIIDKDIAAAPDRIPFEFRILPPANLADWKLNPSHPEFAKLLTAIDNHLRDVSPAPPFKVRPERDLKSVRRWNVKLALTLAVASLLLYLVLTAVPRDNPGLGWDWEDGPEGPRITWVEPGGPAVNVLKEGDRLLHVGWVTGLPAGETLKAAIKEVKKEKQPYAVSVQRAGSPAVYNFDGPRSEVERAGWPMIYIFGPPPPEVERDNFILASLHVLVCGIFVFIILHSEESSRRTKPKWSGDEARRTFYQFIKGWTAVWTTWFMLYLIMMIFSFPGEGYEICEPCYLSVIDFLNISNSVVFFYIFLVLDMPSVPGKRRQNRDQPFRKALKWIYVISFFILLLSALGRFSFFGLQKLGPFFSGFLVAISMSYVFGRLDSHYLGADRRMLAPLYFYAAIQVIGPMLLELSIGVYQTLFFILVLALKVILFFVFYSWQRGRLFERYINKASRAIDIKKKAAKPA